MHARTHTRTHACTHARTHTRTHARTWREREPQSLPIVILPDTKELPSYPYHNTVNA